jgi:hypothetical protein
MYDYILIFSKKGQEIHFGPLKFEEVIALQSGQPQLVVRDYEEYSTSLRSDGRSDQFDENVQVDVAMLFVRYSIERVFIPAIPALAPLLNVAVRVENDELAVEENREASLLQLNLQITQHQET